MLHFDGLIFFIPLEVVMNCEMAQKSFLLVLCWTWQCFSETLFLYFKREGSALDEKNACQKLSRCRRL